ncbi:hypothetical protein GsuE55_08570 [Geobacillus subterraneus]|uniref:Uncharacterized protein n=1 Tax=Geobacillus subterraneus TaxID=129338 RepID=A0A679FT96_9BACL|nr:hypothetical protein GsuE55_08570 [Geobacillus subterraneus]
MYKSFYSLSRDVYCKIKIQSSATKSAELKAKKKGLPASNISSTVEVVNT